MRFITGVLAAIGLLVSLWLRWATCWHTGEAKRRLVGDEFAPERPGDAAQN